MRELERVAAEEELRAVGGQGTADAQQLEARGRHAHDLARAGQGVQAVVEVAPLAPEVAVRARRIVREDGGPDVLVAGAAGQGEGFGRVEDVREDLVAEFGGEGEEPGGLGDGL